MLCNRLQGQQRYSCLSQPVDFCLCAAVRVAPIVYTKHDVDQHGRVQLWASPPAMVSDPIEATLAFQTFYNSLPGKRVNLTIKKYVDEKANCSDRITTGVRTNAQRSVLLSSLHGGNFESQSIEARFENEGS